MRGPGLLFLYRLADRFRPVRIRDGRDRLADTIQGRHLLRQRTVFLIQPICFFGEFSPFYPKTVEIQIAVSFQVGFDLSAAGVVGLKFFLMGRFVFLFGIFEIDAAPLIEDRLGITRDEVFASQIIDLIFCKIYDERFTRPEDTVKFRAGVNEKDEDVRKRVLELFEQVKKQYNDVIDVADSIVLDAKCIKYIVGELQLYSLKDSSRDAVGEAFEIFIGPSLKGAQGQFFTPRNVVNMVIRMIDPGTGERILDPACGSGGFLVEALRYVWNKLEEQATALGWPEAEIEAEKQKVAIKNFRGIDKDSFLSKVAKAYLAILGDGRGGVHCENSLDSFSNWSSKTVEDIQPGTFDIIVTNPPFGKKLAIDSTAILGLYDLGHKWSQESDGTFVKGDLTDKQPPQLLFIERCFEMLRPGGRMGIVLLESIFGMPKYQYIVNYIRSKAKILAIVTLPEDLFQPHTHAKCCVMICQKYDVGMTAETCGEYDIFMSDVKWCGHDSRGNVTYTYTADGQKTVLDEIPMVADKYLEMR